MKISRQDLFTPANGLTLLGLGLCGWGAWHLNSLLGVWLVGTGRLLDVFDGHVARRTHTSAFGALLDASADKFAAFFMLIASWHYHTLPSVVLAFIFIQGIVTVIEYFYVSRLDLAPAPSLAGKRRFCPRLYICIFRIRPFTSGKPYLADIRLDRVCTPSAFGIPSQHRLHQDRTWRICKT